jgi:hypothetical protein
MLVAEIKKRLPGRDVLTDTELKLLLGGGADSRHGRLKRAIAGGDIIRVKRGLYCLSEPFRSRPLDLFALADGIYGPSYVSLESALSFHGWIPETVRTTLCCTNRRSRRFSTPLGEFRFERVTAVPVFAGVDRIAGGGQASTVFVASPWKALADLVYAYKKGWKSTAPLLADLRIEEHRLTPESLAGVGAILASYRSRRVRAFLEGVVAEIGE